MSVFTRAACGALALAAATSTVLFTPAAHAAPSHRTVAGGTSGSIVFVRAGDIWIARGDGSHAHRVTRGGTHARPFHSPSQSDAGVIAAAYGKYIVRLSRTGKILTRVDPPALVNSAGERMDGAVNDVAISPNGRTIAWSFVRYSCPIGADCLTRYATGYTSSTRRTHAGRSTYFRAPSWVGNTRTLLTGGYGSQVELQDVKGAPRHWFDDHDYAFPSTDLADGELSRNGRWLAEVRGYKSTSSIIWYRVSGNARAGAPPAVPAYTCYTNGEAAHASPTWSPDSTALAWAGTGGIWVKRTAADCTSPAPRLLIRNAAQPDWSPAALR